MRKNLLWGLGLLSLFLVSGACGPDDEATPMPTPTPEATVTPEPTATPTPSGTPVVHIPALKDNTLYENAAGLISNGSGTLLFSGRTNQGANYRRRALLAFDIAAHVPAGATVIDATLNLTCSGSSGSGSETMSLHKVTVDWGEGSSVGDTGQGTAAEIGDATWIHTFYDTVFWAAPGGDFSVDVSADAAVDEGSTVPWTSATLISEVQAWLDSPATNFGWLLQGNEADPATTKIFLSRESPTDPPDLVVTYTLP